MGQFTLIKRNGTRIPLNKRIPFCAVKTAQQSRSLMADDTVTLEVVSTFLIDFEKGDKIKIDSDWYTIRTTVDRTKNSEDQYNYSITLYGCIYDLMKVMFRDTDVNGRSTSLTFDLTYSIKDFVKVIIYNMNRDYPGEWVFDDKDCPETEPKTVSFSCQNCLQTLQNECKDFDVDFQITTDKDGIHHIKIGKFGSVVTPPNGEKYFQWGRGHGLFTLVEGKVDDKAIITRMYGEGGTNNIPTAYRNYSERLQLPYPQRLNKHDHKLSDGTVVKAKTMQIGCTDDNKRYIEDAALSKKIGVEEDAIQNDDIYPRRTGKVTALGDDVYTFMDDTMDFDLKASNSNGTTYLIDGTSAKITFITGRLAGREFELHDYDHSAKKFILKPYKDARGLVFPTSNTTAFQIREGDQYKITDIIMPDSYIEDAEEDLWFYVYDKFLQAKQARAQYALTFSRSYFIENMPKDSDSCLFTPGDYVPIKDERFNMEKNIRIQKVERNLLLRHDYTLTISDTATISIINQAVINVQKHDTILEANRLKDLTRAKYGWRTTEELRNMIYDPDGYFDTDNIKPNSIDTNMLTVGSKSQQFVLADVIMQANLGGDPNLFKATSGTLCHLSISDTDIRYWKIAALEATLSEAGGYYLFAKCSKKGDTGSWYLTQEQLKFEPTSDPNNYYFQVGVLSSVYDASWRDFVTTYGFTRINGNTITTGKIVTSDGYCYLDLDGNKFRIGDKQSYIDYNVQQRGQITLHNVRLLSTSGDSSEIGVYRGEYNASYVYYKGDEVSYTNNGVTATYRYIYSEPTKGYAPTIGTYWQCIAKGKDGEKGTPGTPGKDGRDGIDGKDGRDGTDGYSLAPIYRGEYSASKTYYGTQYRVDIVKYNGIYYVARVDAGTFSNVAPTNTSKWNPFGAQFESIATNLLLAEGANIGDWFLSGGKIVSTLSTTPSGKITLDAKGGLIQVESAISGGDHSLYTTMGAKITLDANRGVVQATAKNAPSYSTGTAYMSPSGIFANMAGTDSMSASTGRSHRSAIVGLGFANVSKSAYELNADETLVAGVYGRADNQGSAPAYGGYFWDLKACGLILNTRFIGDSSSYSERCIPKSVSFVIGLCNRNVVKDVYLPNDTKSGRIIKFKQMGAGAMRVRPMSGQHIYDDTSENDYYDCGEGQCLEFVFGIWVKGSTTTNVWTVSKYKF